MCTTTCVQVPLGVRERVGFPETGITGACKECDCWDVHLFGSFTHTSPLSHPACFTNFDYVCACVCLCVKVPVEDLRGCPVLWSWSLMGVPGTELGASVKAACTLSHSPAPALNS